jgi:hypothetical protein
MNKLCLLACLLVSVAHAQTAPKVVFVGDYVTSLWQASPEFTANTNWIGAGVQFGESVQIAANFQATVINQHPAIVHIMVGEDDAGNVRDSFPPYVVLGNYQKGIMQMVAMAQKANIKIILGNSIYLPLPGENFEAITLFNAWLDQYGRANNIPVVNYYAQFCQCVGASTLETAPSLSGYEVPSATIENAYSITDAGSALLTQMAQTAIATYGLTIKGGYLSDVELAELGYYPEEPTPQVNTVPVGYEVDFTAQATWSDGVTRPMLNQDFDGMQGIWTSSNPNVMYISQQGQAIALSAGTTSISFITASGSHFSPWTMTVQSIACAPGFPST